MKNLFMLTGFAVVFLTACTLVVTIESIPSTITFTPTVMYTFQPSITPTLTPTKTPARTPTAIVMTPSSGKITFVSSHKGKYAVYAIKTDGTELTKLTDEMTVVMDPQ